jgi:uncharacterized membrane protein YebE (DUF533 family)
MGQEANYQALAEGIDEMREMVRAMIAGLVADGFSDEQARAIVAGFFAVMGGKKQEGDD